MPEPSKSNSGPGNSDREVRGEAEVLEWMGTAYGRRGDKKATRTDVIAAPSFSGRWADARATLRDRFTGLLAATAGRRRGGIAALVGLLLTVTAMALAQVGSSGGHGANPHALAAAAPSEQTAARADIEREAHEAKSQLASEREARVALEGQVGELVAQLAARTRDRENAERDRAAMSAELAAERKVRAEAEDAASSAKEALARTASVATDAPVARQETQTEQTQADHKPLETPVRAAPERMLTALLGAAPSSDAANAALLQGEKLFAKGDLEAARQRFEQAAELGLPEGALALGNTYDPVSLAQSGLNLPGDPTRARQWYRRALELAHSHQEARQ